MRAFRFLIPVLPNLVRMCQVVPAGTCFLENLGNGTMTLPHAQAGVSCVFQRRRESQMQPWRGVESFYMPCVGQGKHLNPPVSPGTAGIGSTTSSELHSWWCMLENFELFCIPVCTDGFDSKFVYITPLVCWYICVYIYMYIYVRVYVCVYIYTYKSINAGVFTF